MIATDTGWETKVEMGNGRAMGLEFFVQKTAGPVTGKIAYTLAKSDRQFPDGPIADQECTLRVMARPWSVYLPEYRYGSVAPDGMNWSMMTEMPVRVRRTCSFRLRTLDFSQYHYLKALGNLETFGTEVSFLVEPTTLPSNVEGGLGFVGIETITEMPYARFEREYGPVDAVYY